MQKEPVKSPASPASVNKGILSVSGFTIYGIVVHGNHLGRTIGFPTANIQPGDKEKKVFPHGVFLVNVLLDDRILPGVCNIGLRPTIGGTQLVTEVHILDFSEDIYGKEISVTIMKSIRKEKKFSTLDELGNQIRLDKEKARRLLSMLNKQKAG